MAIAKLRKGKYKTGKPWFMVDATLPDGRRSRKFFDDEVLAQNYRDKLIRDGTEALSIPHHIAREAWDCHQRLLSHGWTLTTATDYVLTHVVKFQTKPIIEELVKQFLDDTEKNSGVREATLEDLKIRMSKFVARFGDRQLHTITLNDLKAWNQEMTKDGLGPRSRHHYLTKAGQLFNWDVNDCTVSENPVAKMKLPRCEHGEIGFLSVGECEKLLRAAESTTMVHHIVFGMYLGIRPNELTRLKARHVKIDQRCIILDADVTKTSQRRVIEFPENDLFGDCVMAWLSRYPVRGAPTDLISPDNAYWKLLTIRKVAGVPWPHDALRHTAASFHYAMWNDAIRTSHLLGHSSTKMLSQHYKGLTTRADAERFYRLRPLGSAGSGAGS